MNVTDDVERARVVASVVPKRLAFESRTLHLLGARQEEYPVESFPSKCADGAPELRLLVAQHMRSELSLWTRCVSLGADPLRHVEDDGHGEDVMLLGQSD